MHSTKNIGWIIAILLGIGCMGTFAYAQLTRIHGVAPVAAPAAVDEPVQLPRSEQVVAVEPPARPSDALTPATVERLVRDVMADDAGARADAIDALAAAPEAVALPVLQKVLGSGDDIERQLALSSLHVLALRYGDTDGAIRELLRQSIYDGGDEAVASGAQSALDDIERSGERHASATDALDSDR